MEQKIITGQSRSIKVGQNYYSDIDLALTALEKIRKEKQRGRHDSFQPKSEERHSHEQRQQSDHGQRGWRVHGEQLSREQRQRPDHGQRGRHAHCGRRGHEQPPDHGLRR